MLNRLKHASLIRLALTGLLSTALITGCGGENNDDTQETGEVIIGLTDAEGDFLSYDINVTSIKLMRADGTEVETLPLHSRIDFSQYVDVTELITAATIPSGRYTRASLTLDYADADVRVEVSGEPSVTDMLNHLGQPLTSSMEMTVQLGDNEPVLIAPGIPAHLTLDFDLQASHEVDTSVTPPTAVVQPMLLADVGLKNAKPHRLRGLLKSVDTTSNEIKLNIRPLRLQRGSFGVLTAQSNDATSFEINGNSYTGNAGLLELAALPATTRVVIFGSMNRATKSLLALEVLAGSSLPNATQDIITGVVTARSGDQLTVDAGLILPAVGKPMIAKTVILNLDSSTIIKRQHQGGSYTKDDISVGQRIQFIGQLDTSTGLSISQPSLVRMLLTDANGSVISDNGSELIINLNRLNGRLAANYDFTGTGLDLTQDADPNQYQVDPASLSLNNIATNDPIWMLGFVTPWQSAPADFNATSIINVADAPAALTITWPLGTSSPFTSMDADTGLVLDLSTAAHHHVIRHRIPTTLADAGTLKPTLLGKGVYAIRGNGQIHIYADFGQFVTALGQQLDGSVVVTKIFANGRFDDNTNTLTTPSIRVILEVAP